MHWLLRHCAPATHVAPDPSEPAANAHAAGCVPHPLAFTADAHASRLLVVIELPGRASACAHSLEKRPWIREASLEGSTPPEQPTYTVWK